MIHIPSRKFWFKKFYFMHYLNLNIRRDLPLLKIEELFKTCYERGTKCVQGTPCFGLSLLFCYLIFFHLICHKPVFIPVNKGLHHKFNYGLSWRITMYLTNLLLNLKFNFFAIRRKNAGVNNAVFSSVHISNCFMWF